MTSLPLTSLLSKALVAFTIEFDNEFEQRFPHTTTRGPAAHSGQGPWLVSMPMWSNLMRWLDADVPTSVPIERLIPLVNLPGLRRWGYVTVEADGRIAPTRAGRRAQAVWTPLTAEVEAQWAERFGRDVVERLRRALTAAVEQLEPALPWQLPVSGVRNGEYAQLTGPSPSPSTPLDLAALLARPLMVLRTEFEVHSRLSLPVSANALRLLDREPVRVRDLPARAGVSREAIALCLGLLDRLGLAELDPSDGVRTARLTDRGARAQLKHRRVLAEVEVALPARLGADIVDELRAALDQVVGSARLSEGLQPDPSGWRAHPPYRALTSAMVADPLAGLPAYPMVSHRGGYPDGS